MKLSVESVKNLAKTFGKSVEKHAPEILTGIGVAGFVTTTVLAVKVTPKALDEIDNERRQRKQDILEKLPATVDEDVKNEQIMIASKFTPIDYVKCTWKLYTPVVITGAASIACVLGANHIHLRRHAALVAACTVTEGRFAEYKDKVKEILGDKKEQNVRDEIAKDQIANNPVRDEDIIDTGKGSTLCYDAISGRYFYSDIDEIKRALNLLNHQLLYDESMSLNDLYDFLGLEPNGCGEDFGWNRGRPGWSGIVEPSFSSHLTDKGIPCVVLDFIEGPFYTGYSYLGRGFEA